MERDARSRRSRRALAVSFAGLCLAAAALARVIPARLMVRWEPLAIVSSWGTPTVPAELGRIRVPESRSAGSAGSRQIELAFVRIPALSPSSRPPIVWLSGGPGESGIADLDTPELRLFLELRRVADVIVLDQRGTGLSVPRLDCPGGFHFPPDAALDRDRALAALEAAARACSQRWRSEGVDISAYNARESAEDVEDLRVALGVPRLDILAGSYGTHVALAAIRAHEDRFERVVLLGVAGPDHLLTRPSDLDGELAAVTRLASASSGQGRPARDLLWILQELRQRLAARPARVSLRSPDGNPVEIVLGRFDLDWYVRSLLSSRESIAHLPALLEAMGAGDFRELAEVSARWRTSPAPSAARFAARCASGASADRMARIEREGEVAVLSDAVDFAEQRVCRAWGVEPLPEEFRAPVRSQVPILLVSGTLDGTTPAANVVEMLPGLSRASQLVIEGGAHGLLAVEESASRTAIARFFETGGAPRERHIALGAIPFEPAPPPGAARGDRLAAVAAGAFPAIPSPFAGR